MSAAKGKEISEWLNSALLWPQKQINDILLSYIPPILAIENIELTNAMSWTCQHVINWSKEESQREIWEHESQKENKKKETKLRKKTKLSKWVKEDGK